MIDLESFFKHQLSHWEMANNNYNRLNEVLYRTIEFDDFSIKIQCNPDRIVSATARIDRLSLQSRPCFLCKEHLPASQDSVSYNENFDIRINPFPIFTPHFTVPAKRHIPQVLENYFRDMLSMAKDFPDYTVFYNGPRSGASAPDHLHFQLVPRHSMPLENDVINCSKETILPAFLTCQEKISSIASPVTFKIESITRYIRKNLILRTADEKIMQTAFQYLLTEIGKVTPNNPEPMLNLFVWYENGEWYVVLFPRQKHRPRQFFAEGKEHILFSPGCVDFAGVVISPRKEDFERFDAPLLSDLFGQLTLDDNQWNNLIRYIEHPNL
ncbi:DUF4922 domain-containing protein [Sanguibacteroides sp. AM78-02pH3A]|uniref:DUF4922 domain-containing protein n=1 Tax=Sanguibacteroides sp. AM78-02pH3A TaxID=3002646 RepID=UPI0022E83B27|nr:DUF4922 domain-containing protein [Sanguibacteroides sp. AM78-02pH3A]